MRAVNAVRREHDPSSHAETRTVRLACKKLKRTSLAGYTMYSTCEPCAMCMANALWAGLDRVVFGATIADANRIVSDSHPGEGSLAALGHALHRRGPRAARAVQHAFHAPEYAEGVSQHGHRQSRGGSRANRLASEDRTSQPRPCNPITPPHSAPFLATTRACSRSRRSSSGSPAISTGTRPCCASSSTAKSPTSSFSRSPRHEIQNVLALLLRARSSRHHSRRRHRQLRPGGPAARRNRPRSRAHGPDRSDQPDGVAVCQPGVRLGVLETEARKADWELRCYPSTIVKATVGGFLGGGSGGIGSVAHGGLRDFETVRAHRSRHHGSRAARRPHEGEAVHEILHAWGTNGVITRIWLALAPAVEWAQCAVAFDTFDEPSISASASPRSPNWTKRLVTVFEWPIPSFFSPVKQYAPEGKAADLLHDRRRAARRSRSRRAAGRRRSHATPALITASAPARCSPITPGTTPRSGP